MAPVIITGVRLPDGGAQPASPAVRLEINDFVKNEKYFSLYIQSLKKMYETNHDATEPTSYYQIAGIHGQPILPWNDATRGKDVRGYCAHSSVLFPTWHRAYMLLFEQTLQQHAVKIANDYVVDKDLWVKAATELRQPFWDWARAEGPIPPEQIISMEKVEITKADGVKKFEDNPFLAFKFPSKESRASFSGPYKTWETTLRNPVTQGGKDVSSVDKLKGELRGRKNLTSDVYNALLNLKTWDGFSNRTRTQEGNSPYSSLESIHDRIHMAVGKGGHMNSPSVAAYDPIFYLHHCQIDRLLSLWSACHPGLWVSPRDGDNESTELLPFWNSTQSKWPSSGLKDTTNFNYTYPEFKDVNLNGLSAPEYFKLLIKHLYNGGPDPRLAPRTTEEIKLNELHFKIAETDRADSATALASSLPSAPIFPASANALQAKSVTAEKETSTIWTARIRCNDFEVKSSFSVFIFMGQESEIPNDSAQWLTSPNFIGLNDVFVNSNPEQCTNCTKNSDLLIEGYVQLTNALKNSVQSVKEDVVTPYLRENLQWRVAKTDGAAIDLKSLEIMVLATPISKTVGKVFPSLGEPRELHECTEGRY